MTDWKTDKRWSDKFLPEIKSILGMRLIGEASVEEFRAAAQVRLIGHQRIARRPGFGREHFQEAFDEVRIARH